MRSYFLSLPRAPWKARVMAALVTVLLIAECLQLWPHRHDDLAIARWVAWGMLFGNLWLLRMALVVCLAGRLPRVLRRNSLNRTLPQIRAEIAEELREQRRRSRYL